MTTTERSEKQRTAALNRNIAKVPTATLKRIQEDAKAEAIDAYEKEHRIGKYQQNFASIAAAPRPTYPTQQEMSASIHALETRVLDAEHITGNESVLQQWEMAHHHLRVVNRHIAKALRT